MRVNFSKEYQNCQLSVANFGPGDPGSNPGW